MIIGVAPFPRTVVGNGVTKLASVYQGDHVRIVHRQLPFRTLTNFLSYGNSAVP